MLSMPTRPRRGLPRLRPRADGLSRWGQTLRTRLPSRRWSPSTEAELGLVTILVNSAGVAWQGTLDTYDREQVARMRQVNVDGVIHATRAVMGACGRGATGGLSIWPRSRRSAPRWLAMHSTRQRRPRW